PRSPLANATAHVEAPVANLWSGAPLAWKASGRVHLVGFPIGRVTPLADRSVRGTLTGDVAIDGIHTDDGRVTADLRGGRLETGTTKYTGAKVSAVIDRRSFHGALRIDQADGFVESKAQAGVRWDDGILPRIDPTQALDASLVAKNARASGLQPFTASL